MVSKRQGRKNIGGGYFRENRSTCGHCSMCRMGNYRLCDASDTMLGAPGTYLRHGGAIQLRIFECWREGTANREAEEV